MLQAIVFDFDGVIVNSEPLHLRAYQEVLGAEGISLSAREYAEQYLGLDDEGVFGALAEAHGIPARSGWVRAMIARKTARMERLLAGGGVLFAGAADCIRECAEQVPLAVASGAFRQEILHVLETVGLRGLFAAIVGAGETPRGKPAPDPYVEAIRQLGAATGTRLEASRVVAIEDSRQGLASARAAGLKCVAVTTTYPAGELAGADLVVSDISAITVERLSTLWSPGA